MSESANEVERWLADQKERAREQHEIWARVDEERFRAVMDKEPTLWYGPDFVQATIPEPPFLVKPFFPSGGLCLLHGKRGIGKSMLTMALAHSVATGEPFLDMFEARQGNVVVIQLDMVESVYHDRLQVAPEFYSFDNWYTLTGVASFSEATSKTNWVQEVVATIPDLIIIDTLRKAHRWDENSSDTPAKFYNKLRDLFGYTAVVMVHHDRKSSMDSSGLDPAESFRGSGAWLDDVDCGLHIVKRGKYVDVEFSKVRTCDELGKVPCVVDPDKLVLTPVTAAEDLATKTGVSKDQLARTQARTFLRANPSPPRLELYDYLKDGCGHPKYRASRIASEFLS